MQHFNLEVSFLDLEANAYAFGKLPNNKSPGAMPPNLNRHVAKKKGTPHQPTTCKQVGDLLPHQSR